ncbi:EAL domain-containing protein, partial [Lactobacillus sp.]|uniref:EAL domain-containing protein n=1 Tax=Lactobacillus sp. TaxID=1591 RepID=UPI003F058324
MEIVYANKKLLDLFACEDLPQFAIFAQEKLLPPLKEQEPDHAGAVLDSDNAVIEHLSVEDRVGQEHLLNMEIRKAEAASFDLRLCYITPININRDLLTGLLDLRSFQEVGQTRTKEMIKQGKHVSLISFDLVGMKDYNNQYGFKQGDDLLRFVADCIKESFGNQACTRSGEDRFYAYCEEYGLEDRLKELVDRIRSRREVRVGVANLDLAKSDFDSACNQARVACESLEDPYKSGIVYYDEKLDQRHRLQEYILNHIDEALEKGWVQVYFQPVIRTLTDKVCNLEALSRWIDPKYGMISPGVFVPVLEGANLSYKLDLFVLNYVAKMLADRFQNGQDVVPVSINISRSDFTVIDPVQEISQVADHYQINHQLLCIEITETAVMQSQHDIVEAIDRFHQLNFEVWMDDFGSGYSSLNALKDFDFNEIKIDMAFMRDFNDRSKKIVSKAVAMAKSLKIHTLTEGVETEEQVAFLKSIGCERIQGFYYGKPQPIKELEASLAFKKLSFENSEEAKMYSKLGLIDVMVPQPITLCAYDGQECRIFFENQAFKELLGKNKIDQDWLMKIAEMAVVQHQKVAKTFIYDNRYSQISLLPVVEGRNVCLMEMRIDGTIGEVGDREFALNSSLKNILPIYNRIYLLDFAKDSWDVIASDLPGEKTGIQRNGIQSFRYDYGLRCVMHDDLAKWRNLLDYQSLQDRLDNLDNKWFTTSLRTQIKNGDYAWADYTVISYQNQQYILLVKIDTQIEESQREGLLKNIMKNQHQSLDNAFGDVENQVWKTIIKESNLKIFWKDAQRRFVGVSQAFLDFYGFKSQSELLGKTDDQIGWHVNNKPFRDDELEVLQTGQPAVNAKTTAIVKGALHQIVASKFPVFEDGKVIGLVGYFDDVNLKKTESHKPLESRGFDYLANFLDASSLVPELAQFDTAWKHDKQSYTVCWLEISNYSNLQMKYGQRFCQLLIEKCAKLISQQASKSAILARVKDASFIIISNFLAKEEMQTEVDQLLKELKGVWNIGGFDCKLKPIAGLAQASEVANGQEAINLANRRSQSQTVNPVDFQVFDEYLDLPLPMVVNKPLLSAHGDKVIDTINIFTNERYCELVGVNKGQLFGERYLDYVSGEEEWMTSSLKALKGYAVSGQCYCRALRSWVSYYSKASTVPNCVVTVFAVDDRDSAEIKRIVATDAEFFEANQQLLDDRKYFRAIQNALQEIGDVTQASHAVLLEI